MKRTQRLAAILLWAAAAVMLVLVCFKASAAKQGAAVSLEPVSLPGEVRRAAIDLNTAGEEELRELPGVGETLAARIADWRAENGGFSCREDVLAVPGIGEKTYEKIEAFITY